MNVIQLGDKAPNFIADSSKGKIDFHEWLGESWGMLVSHPADFTPVCTTELGMMANYGEEFENRNVKVAAISVDPLESHQRWIEDINETQHAYVDFPLIADDDRSVSELYGMIHPNADSTMTVRSVFIIAPNKEVKLMLTYPASTGRNFDELLRVIDSLQLTAYQKLATPANWEKGDRAVIVPSVSDKEAAELFPAGFETVKPYLRLAELPA
ncbi:peroxiredoxin [Flagellimonas allohymeniacidonis]|uniref:Peroxiredoxin n=1 Tax=Flagellimonas allohymeniacidonis TaxID=2517819 RepID=A0A4Q8QKG7_9FLAO|nr:peroxiredoxin [Allomuricauda hymeniacidonis]TAI49009.1 peroxiredoxin [Allomuricauda hymeniacidonis]